MIPSLKSAENTADPGCRGRDTLSFSDLIRVIIDYTGFYSVNVISVSRLNLSVNNRARI